MKKAALFITTLLLLIYSCTSEKKSPFLSTNNIRLQIFTIDPLKENQIKGARGGLFTIPAGAFEGTGTVTIELKEVYAPIEILASGLSTESNGELLESGGMFFLNAKRDGKALTLKKEINGSIPAEYINDSMKLFKGELKEDGSVNWIEPEALETTADSNTLCIKEGERMFQTNCASCHAVTKKITGPELINSANYYSKEEYFELVQNPARFASKNKRFNCLIRSYNGVLMTGFPAFTREDVNCLMKYFENEAKRRPDLAAKLDSKDFGFEGCDSFSILKNEYPCGTKTYYIDTTPIHLDPNLPPMYAEASKNEIEDSLYKKTETLEPYMRNGFADKIETTNSDKYNFKIKTLGWFNVDAYFQPLKGTSVVDLYVDTDFKEEDEIDVHVFLPSKKILTVGIYHSNDGLFHFEKYKGQIPLYLEDDAVVFAVTSIGEKMYYGISSFKVAKSQTIKMEIKETNQEDLLKAINKMNLDGIDLDVITKKQITISNPCNDSIPPAK